MIIVEKWQGMITNASPYAIPPGAFASQVNLQCVRPGQIEGRGGYSMKNATVLMSMIQYTPGVVAGVDGRGQLHVIGVT